MNNVWILFAWYYDFCENWDTIVGVYDSEDKAIYAQIEEESDPKYKNTEQYYTTIDCYELK